MTAVDAIRTDEGPRVVLTARRLGRDFSGFTAVNNVNLDVHHAVSYTHLTLPTNREV